MSYLAPYVNPTKAWIFPFFATAYLGLLLSNFLFIIGWALLKNKLWLLSFIAILLGLTHLGSYFNLSIQNPKEDQLSIMSYNIGAFLRSEKLKKDTNYKKEFLSFFKDMGKPDILCLQESPYYKLFKDSLQYKYSLRKGTMYIFSDLPHLDRGVLDFPNTSNRIIWADIKSNGQTVSVVNVHLQSNKVSEQTEDLASNIDLAEKETWTDMRSVIGKVKRATAIRTKQAEEAQKFIAASPYPVVLAGDFNDTPLSYTYALMSNELEDAYIKKGSGIGITYAGKIPGLRIDYIMGSKEIDFTSYTCSKVDFSDHYPIHSHFEISSN
jgi:endonuclease/exonuclease/phosphatase family metal-dependent hydrolase